MAPDHPIFDFIIIGAGSAGCVIANRLSENPDHSVLLIEAGPSDKSRWIHIPAGIMKVLQDKSVLWENFTEPEPGLKGRKIYWPHGKTLGGSSSINGMAYVRGQPADYDTWAQMGCTGWSWDDVLPYFIKSENSWLGPSRLHGSDGGLEVTSPDQRISPGASLHRATQAFIDGSVAAGLPFNSDYNGDRQDGVSWLNHTIDRRGRRHSTSSAFLKPAAGRANLTIWTEAMVERIVVENGRATGVTLRQRGLPKTALARREIILSAGAINSPQLLMLSGIGPGEDLRAHGIPVTVESPMVGRNLQDHFYVFWVHEVKEGLSFSREISGRRLLPHVAEYFLRRKGLLTTGASSAYIFCKSMPDADTPDTQIGFRAFTDEMFVSGVAGAHDFPGWTAAVTYLRPKSRGRISLRSANPNDSPVINANYLSHSDDLQAIMAALRLVDKVYATPKIASMVVKRLAPNADIDVQNDSQLEDYIRSRGGTMYHPVGTCGMGMGPDAVVDQRLRVRGVAGLRVADCSIMPNIVSGNTNAPAIMIGEKAAAMVIEDQRRPSS